jgi:hypothetical protein
MHAGNLLVLFSISPERQLGATKTIDNHLAQTAQLINPASWMLDLLAKMDDENDDSVGR